MHELATPHLSVLVGGGCEGGAAEQSHRFLLLSAGDPGLASKLHCSSRCRSHTSARVAVEVQSTSGSALLAKYYSYAAIIIGLMGKCEPQAALTEL